MGVVRRAQRGETGVGVRPFPLTCFMVFLFNHINILYIQNTKLRGEKMTSHSIESKQNYKDPNIEQIYNKNHTNTSNIL